ncbi:MAG: nucleoside monophosphate kinase [Verrucomicrobia bacterium]|nr:nucleoside monophosphate kinase [Verrucomicrobiota bacterium]
MNKITASKNKSATPTSSHDLEVKDGQIIFNSVWNKLVEEIGEENLRFPKEIFWLNGAPGAGKGTNTDFIMRYRDLTAPPLVVSSELQSPDARARIDAGQLVGDREVAEIILRRLLNPEFQFGAVVDGFPRTKVQVECLKHLHHKLSEMHLKYRESLYSDYFKKPHFHIVVLFVDEKESVRRQLYRGEQAQAHNAEVDESGVGELMEVRPTDLSPEAAHNRYRTFKEKTYDALQDLRQIFFYHFINAHGTIEEVRKRIFDELRYQGSLELDESTYERLSSVPVASSLSLHARQDLVDRLDAYEKRETDLFKEVVDVILSEFMPIVKLHAISGTAVINSENAVFTKPKALEMLIDIFSERGYHAIVDVNKLELADSIDPKTFKISNTMKRVFRVRIRFEGSEIRRGR